MEFFQPFDRLLEHAVAQMGVSFGHELFAMLLKWRIYWLFWGMKKRFTPEIRL